MKASAAIVLGAMLVGVTACASGGTADWPASIDQLEPMATTSKYKAVFPPDLAIVKPGADIPHSLALYSGRWAGGMCDQGVCDAKLGIERITRTTAGFEATGVFAFASILDASAWCRFTVPYRNGAFQGNCALSDGTAVGIRFRMRSDGMMNIARSTAVRDGWGVLPRLE